jgi:two-component system sensor histidine kinase PhcS
MASLGRMSAGIIHEINNPLNYALTALELLSLKAASLPDEERAEYAETVRDIEEGLRRVAGIIGDLRIFTHPQGGEIEDVPVRHAANAALRFLAAELKNRVVVENRLPESLTVPAVRSKLIQVFVNLLQNSLDALADRLRAEPAPRITLSAETHEGVTTVRVRDNGHGIPPELQSRIFDPFFTTKDVGEGTGLGLSICFRLLNEVGASITVRSQVGEFCEFTMMFAERISRGRPQAVTEAVS